MRALQFPGDRVAMVSDAMDPSPGPGEVRVSIRAAGICGSDLHAYRASRETRDAAGLTRRVPGHEPAGVIDRLGAGVHHLRVGDRVAVYHYLGCGYCAECRAGRLMWCERRRGYGGAIDGADADYIVADARNCLPLPENMPFVSGALMMCVGGTAFEALQKLQCRPGDALVISGLGPVGLAALLFANTLGLRVIGVEPSEFRRDLAVELGIVDVVDPSDGDLVGRVRGCARSAVLAGLETSGQAAGRQGVVDVLDRGGRAVFVGFGSSVKTLNPESLIDRQLGLYGSFVFPISAYDRLLRFMLGTGELLVAMVTNRCSLEEVPALMPDIDHGRTGKCVITAEGSSTE